MVNAKRDTRSYESTVNGERGYQRDIISDGNALYRAFLKSKKNSDWKASVQKFETNYLLGLGDIQKELREGTYEFHEGSTFTIRERGKARRITGECIQDRIVEHVLCDEIINPAIKKYLIYDNGASQEGKGVTFTRRRLETHLQRYYKRHNSNNGYILLIDFSKYYDNIQHDMLMKMLRKYVTDISSLDLTQQIVNKSRVDVSYMSDDQYAKCMDGVFDSIKHDQVDKSLLNKQKWLPKHLNIGNQVSQSAGILYRTPIDNYIKIVRGVKEYAAYMDDSYAIHESKEFLEDLLDDIVNISKDIGITVNKKKTRICKLSDKWRFLQVQYSLTETGRIIHKINPKNITRMRRKAKKLCGVLCEKDFDNWMKSWIRGYAKYMSRKQRENICKLTEKLRTNHYQSNQQMNK